VKRYNLRETRILFAWMRNRAGIDLEYIQAHNHREKMFPQDLHYECEKSQTGT